VTVIAISLYDDGTFRTAKSDTDLTIDMELDGHVGSYPVPSDLRVRANDLCRTFEDVCVDAIQDGLFMGFALGLLAAKGLA
jgi:hypothetical protein